MGGFVGPTVIGAMKDRFGTHDPAFTLLGGCAIVVALLAIALREFRFYAVRTPVIWFEP